MSRLLLRSAVAVTVFSGIILCGAAWMAPEQSMNVITAPATRYVHRKLVSNFFKRGSTSSSAVRSGHQRGR